MPKTAKHIFFISDLSGTMKAKKECIIDPFYGATPFNKQYEGVSINNQPIPFPMDRDGHDLYALFQYMFSRVSSHSFIRY